MRSRGPLAVSLCLAICAAGLLGGVLLLWAGRARLQVPDLPRWQEETEPARESPPLLARVLRHASPGGRSGDDEERVELEEGPAA